MTRWPPSRAYRGCYSFLVGPRFLRAWLGPAAAVAFSCKFLAAGAASGPSSHPPRVGLVGFARDAPARMLLASHETGTFQLFSLDLRTRPKQPITPLAARK